MYLSATLSFLRQLFFQDQLLADHQQQPDAAPLPSAVPAGSAARQLLETASLHSWAAFWLVLGNAATAHRGLLLMALLLVSALAACHKPCSTYKIAACRSCCII